jgi:hypothetical protein
MPRPKQETIKRSFLFSLALDEKLAEIQEHLGLRTMTSAIEYCVNSTYKKEIDNYVTVNKNRTPRPNMTADERAESSASKYREREEARAKLAMERGEAIAEALGGTIENDNAGNRICRWKIYQKETPHYVSVGEFARAVVELTEDLIDTQYRGGTREEIEAILANQEDK